MAPRSSVKTWPPHSAHLSDANEDALRRRLVQTSLGSEQIMEEDFPSQRVASSEDRLNPQNESDSPGSVGVHNTLREEDNRSCRHTFGSSLNPITPTTPCLVHASSFIKTPAASGGGSTMAKTSAAVSSTSSHPPSPACFLRRQRAPGASTFSLARMRLPRMLLPAACFSFLLIGMVATPCEAICPETCDCDDVALVVRCEPSPNLDVMPLTFNPALQQLTMYGTEIHTLDSNNMMFYLDLRHVNLSKNMIMKVMPRTFEKQEHLEELHLAQNNISELEPSIFLGLDNLIVLSLRGNVIESLGERVFIHLTQLKDLDLSENRLEHIDDMALDGLSNLRVLHLHDNRLATIPSSNLALVPDLAYLSLGGNEFLEVREGDLQSMKTLIDLNLSGAQLGDGLTKESFQGLSGLRKLMLEDCGLQEVPTAALSPLTKLEELHIGRNMFTSLPPNSFMANRHLYKLYISGCPDLMYVNKDVLHNNVNIKHIVITQNPQLTYIDEDAFRFLSELSLLDLHGNNIKRLSENAASWKDIDRWSLEGNPIACNCSAAWLHALTHPPNSSSSIKCASPPRLAGAFLSSTQLSDLACGMDPATQGLVIGLVVIALVMVIAIVVVIMLYRHHGSCVHRLLKGHRLDRHGGTFGNHSCGHDYHQPVPVTEL